MDTTCIAANRIRWRSEQLPYRSIRFGFAKYWPSRFNNLGWFKRFNSCCHIRTTIQPRLRSVLFTRLSRRLLRASFCSQKRRFDAGLVRCFGQLCQKHPSTKMVNLSFGKTKSGLPNIRVLRLQPVMRCCRKIEISRNSVSRFSLPRIRDITSERFFREKTSAIPKEYRPIRARIGPAY